MNFAIKTLFRFILLIQASIVFSWDHPKFAEPGQFPYQVSLEFSLSPQINAHHCCGGSIISQLWVLTSAFCVTNMQVGGLVVKVGRHDIAADDQYVQKIEIDKIIVHPQYPGTTALENLGPYDLAMVKLKKPVTFNARVQPIQLPHKQGWLGGSYKLNYNMVLSGWGAIATGVHANHPKTLQTVNVPVIPNKVCMNSITTVYPHFKLQDSQMCTRPIDGSLAACIGDHGGPLVQYDDNNLPVLIGVYSWSTMPCNTIGLPPIYTRVPPFVKWIEKSMKE